MTFEQQSHGQSRPHRSVAIESKRPASIKPTARSKLPHELQPTLGLAVQQAGSNLVLKEDVSLLNLIRLRRKSKYLHGRGIKCDGLTMLIQKHKPGF